MSEHNTTNPCLNIKRALIVGLGKTGLSCARFLAAQGVEIAVTDSRDIPPGLDELQATLPDVAVFVGGFNDEAFARAECLVVSPGVSLREPLIAETRARGVRVIGDIELFAHFADAPVIAITGSNGKSTVTTLVGLMAKRAGKQVGVGGNIGTPALDLLTGQNDLYVLELSSFQLETTESLDTCAAALLNISEDHMDRYTSLADYTAAKAKIFHGNGVLVINADDERVTATANMISRGRTVIEFSATRTLENGFGVCSSQGQAYLCHANQPLLPVSELKIKGVHNVANALAALALGFAADLPMPAMLEALREFPGLPHRCQWVAEYNGVTWYNDSKATNIGATLAAIQGLAAHKIILIAGGQGKGQDFSPMKDVVASLAREVILIGEDAAELEKVFKDNVSVFMASSMQQAVERAKSVAEAGDAVLLSPACASFDMFSGFEQRGEVFSKLVRESLA